MKNLIFISLVLLIFNISVFPCPAQTTDNDVQTLSKDILNLKKESYRLKTNVTGNINELKKSIEASKELYMGVDSRIISINDSLAKTNSKVAKMQEDTNSDFLRYKSYFIIAFIFFILLIAALTFMFLMLLSKLNKEQTNLYTKLTEFIDHSNKQISSTFETLNNKIDDNIKLFENQINQTSANLEKGISQAKQTTVDHLSKLKSDFETQIDEIKKTIKDLSSKMHV
jgi:DNA repair exonuclease SbcCD ATPase subunit